MAPYQVVKPTTAYFLQHIYMTCLPVNCKKALMGYTGSFCERSGAKMDGCATFVRNKLLRLVEQEDVMYHVQGHPVLDR